MTMHSNRSAPPSTEAVAEIAYNMYPFLRKYKDGRVERLVGSTFVPSSESPGATGVATRDVVVDPATGVSARLFLSAAAAATGNRLPLIVYFHGGAFCTGSAFSRLFHRYAASLSARAGALVVSVDYRLAPEHPVPAAYDDAWAALQWVASPLSDPWLADHADPARVFLAGESAGANIVHNVASRAATPDGDDIDIEGLVLLQPFFRGAERLPVEAGWQHDGRRTFAPERVDTFWPFLTGGAAGNDDPRLNPPADQVASLPCRRALVSVASQDLARDRGRRYAALLEHGEWCRQVTLVESEGEDHAFHLYRPGRVTAVALMDCVVEFINEKPNAVAETNEMCWAALANGSSREKFCASPRSMAPNALVVGPQKASAPAGFGQTLGYSRSSKLVRKGPFGHAVLGRSVARACPWRISARISLRESICHVM